MTRRRVGFALYVVLSALTIAQLIAIGRPWGMVGLVPLVLVHGRTHLWIATAIVLSAIVFNVSYLGVVSFDPIENSQAALREALGGGTPYGVVLPGHGPYPYGPLGLVWWAPGPAVEFIAAAGLLALLGWSRAWITLAVVAGVPNFHYFASAGNNDFSPALLAVGALLVADQRPALGGALLAVSAALKPYTGAWAPATIRLGGWHAAAALVLSTAVLWLPLLFWGVGSFVAALAGANEMRPPSPTWQYIIGAALLGAALFMPPRVAVLSGSAAFVLLLFNAAYVHIGYLVPLIAVSGLSLERDLARKTAP